MSKVEEYHDEAGRPLGSIRRGGQRQVPGAPLPSPVSAPPDPPRPARTSNPRVEGRIPDPVEARNAVRALLEYIGEDTSREGLLSTPDRVVRSFVEMTSGYREDPEEVLGTAFTERCDEVVILRGIDFVSLCEHHLLPFTGTATVGYLPNQVVVGLSKLARLVECFARRLQVQERLTSQVAEALYHHPILQPKGVGVVITAHHSCMVCRGVRKAGAEMVTSSLLGVFRDKPDARSEFLALAHR